MASKVYSDLHVRLDKNIKTQAEAILDDYGISPSGAINIFYHQVISHEGLPFKMARKDDVMLDADIMTPKQVANHLKKAEQDFGCKKYQTADEAFQEILGDRYKEI